MKVTPNTTPVIHLVGDPEENFYQLGVRDRDDCKIVLEHIQKLLHGPRPLVYAIERIGERLLPLLKEERTSTPYTAAYARGLDMKEGAFYYLMILPEIMSYLSTWFSGNNPTPGGRSYFLWDEEEDAPIHGRTLDFPLLNSFDRRERVVLYDFPNMPKIWSLGTAGLPYPSLTAMTDCGVSFALQQKYCNNLHYQGVAIFEMAFELLSQCSDKHSALEMLQGTSSIAYWDMHMGFKNGDVLLVELLGDRLEVQHHCVEPGKFLKLCNGTVDKEDQLKLKKNNAAELIRKLATPKAKRQTEGPISAKDFERGTVWGSTLQVVAMNPKEASALLIPGEAPKFYRGDISSWSRSFEAPTQEIIKYRRSKVDPQYIAGVRRLMLAQTAHDLGDTHSIYHHLQIAIEELEGYPEEAIGKFFFLVFQYIHEKQRKVRLQLLPEFKKLKNKLPPKLHDHLIIFTARLEKCLQVPKTAYPRDLTFPRLKHLLEAELKLPSIVLHHLTTTLTSPRIDLLDLMHPPLPSNLDKYIDKYFY